MGRFFSSFGHAVGHFAANLLGVALPKALPIARLVAHAVSVSTVDGVTDTAKATAIVSDGVAAANLILADAGKDPIDPGLVDASLADVMSLIGHVSHAAHTHPANAPAAPAVGVL